MFNTFTTDYIFRLELDNRSCAARRREQGHPAAHRTLDRHTARIVRRAERKKQ